jgi:hypothetical protein
MHYLHPTPLSPNDAGNFKMNSGQDIGPLGAYALSKKGKATADITYSPDDPPEAYTNSTVHSRISSYCDSAHAIHGLDFDPYNEAISGEAAMRVGGGKQHGRYWVADPLIDSSRTPTLSQIRAKDRRQGESSSGVRSRPTAAECIITNLQVLAVSFVLNHSIIT